MTDLFFFQIFWLFWNVFQDEHSMILTLAIQKKMQEPKTHHQSTEIAVGFWLGDKNRIWYYPPVKQQT